MELRVRARWAIGLFAAASSWFGDESGETSLIDAAMGPAEGGVQVGPGWRWRWRKGAELASPVRPSGFLVDSESGTELIWERERERKGAGGTS